MRTRGQQQQNVLDIDEDDDMGGHIDILARLPAARLKSSRLSGPGDYSERHDSDSSESLETFKPPSTRYSSRRPSSFRNDDDDDSMQDEERLGRSHRPTRQNTRLSSLDRTPPRHRRSLTSSRATRSRIQHHPDANEENDEGDNETERRQRATRASRLQRRRRESHEDDVDEDSAIKGTERQTRSRQNNTHEAHSAEDDQANESDSEDDVEDEDDEDREGQRYSFRDRNAPSRHVRTYYSEFLESPLSSRNKQLRKTAETTNSTTRGNSDLYSGRNNQAAMDRATRYAMRNQKDDTKANSINIQCGNGNEFSERTSSSNLSIAERKSKRLLALLDISDPTTTTQGYSLRNRTSVKRPLRSSNSSNFEKKAAATHSQQHANAYREYLKRRASNMSHAKTASSMSHSRHQDDRRKRNHHRYARDSQEDSSSDDEEDRVVKRHKRELNAILPINDIHTKHGNSGMTHFLRADVAPIEIDKSVSWDSIGGLTSHIDALKEMALLPMLYPEFYAKFGIVPPSGVLFYGPPGTGKTLLARALANSCTDQHITFYMRKGADCLSKWVGEAERQLRLLFEQAKRTQPSIIFFDEIDGLAPVRSAKQDQIHASIVSTLLALMDGIYMYIYVCSPVEAILPSLR